jgi:ribosome-associated protein
MEGSLSDSSLGIYTNCCSATGSTKTPLQNGNTPNPATSDPAVSPETPLSSGAANALPAEVHLTVQAAYEKKAENLRIFDLRGVTSLTEFFVICSGTNQRQNQAISDEVFRLLKEQNNLAPLGIEGYDKADWILMDYGDFIVHILSSQARKYYDIERLWRQAKEVQPPEDLAGGDASASTESSASTEA